MLLVDDPSGIVDDVLLDVDVELLVGSVVLLELVVLTVVSVESVLAVVSVVVVVVVVGRRVVADARARDAVDAGSSASGSPGPIGNLACGERTFGPILGPAGLEVVVVEISSGSSGTSASRPVTAGSTETALMARGAATATAATVDNDSANKNRPRPVVSSGRWRYIQMQKRG